MNKLNNAPACLRRRPGRDRTGARWFGSLLLMLGMVFLCVPQADAQTPAQKAQQDTTGALVGPLTASALKSTSLSNPKPQGPLTPVSDMLARYGISFRGVLFNEMAGNPVGGIRQGVMNVGQLNFGTDIDLQTLVGIPGASFHVTIYRDYGYSLALEDTGTFAPQQNIYKNPYTKIHYGLFAYEQKLFDNTLDVIVGRLGTTAFYGHTMPNCIVQAGTACALPDILKTEAGYGLLPSATWGTNITVRPRPDIYLQTGAFEVNPTAQPSTGLDWSIHDSTGVTVPVELGWSHESLQTYRHPFSVKVGAWDTTAPHADPYYNTKNQPLALYGGTARQDSARDGGYILAYDTIWRPNPHSGENIRVLGGYVQPFENEEVLDKEVFAGIQFAGVIRGRPQDTLGLVGTYLHVSPREIANLDARRAKLGGTGLSSPREGVLEAAYQIELIRNLRVTPNIQYWIDPDNAQITNTRILPKNIVVFGLVLAVGWSQILGFAGAAGSAD